jgi:hypothetical protein
MQLHQPQPIASISYSLTYEHHGIAAQDREAKIGVNAKF